MSVQITNCLNDKPIIALFTSTRGVYQVSGVSTSVAFLKVNEDQFSLILLLLDYSDEYKIFVLDLVLRSLRNKNSCLWPHFEVTEQQNIFSWPQLEVTEQPKYLFATSFLRHGGTEIFVCDLFKGPLYSILNSLSQFFRKTNFDQNYPKNYWYKIWDFMLMFTQ